MESSSSMTQQLLSLSFELLSSPNCSQAGNLKESIDEFVRHC